jgi:hypothetical protein
VNFAAALPRGDFEESDEDLENFLQELKQVRGIGLIMACNAA